MSRKKQIFRRNMLIVCEGKVSEPEYIDRLRTVALEKGAWDAIEIRPKDKEDEDTIGTPSTHKTPRSKRTLTISTQIEDHDPILNDYDIKSQPICWVKEARDGLKDDTYDQVWAVFDYDGRLKTEFAFRLAQEKINDKVVKIAFSNVAFEHWILLHFERNSNTFLKSQCRINKKIIECGSGKESNDCQGVHCLIGYLRHKGYLAPYASTKKGSQEFNIWNDLIQNRKIAYENAAWLRHKLPVITSYPGNPYTNVDHLVQSMLIEEYDLSFGYFNKAIEWESLTINVTIKDEFIIFNLLNEGTRLRVLGIHDLHIEIVTDSIRQDVVPEPPILEVNETKKFSIGLPSNLISIVFHCKFRHIQQLIIFEE